MTVLDYRQSPRTGAGADTGSLGHWLGWAVYLAMSWTWCIGMFLPVLLVRDYGIWGWIAFAVPNVLGAAAMGWVLRRPESSRNMVAAHRPAMICFSAVTVAFQFFFAAWMFYPQDYSWMLPATAVLAAVMLIPASSAAKRVRFEHLVAIAVLLVSLACMFFVVKRTVRSVPSVLHAPARPVELLALAPVMAFGFLLCPYLDVTFHHARRHTSSERARLAFSIGFGVIFLVMIAFTVAYGPELPFRHGSFVLGPARWALAAYLMVQLAFTVGVHVREGTDRLKQAVWVGCAVLVAAACVGTGSFWLGDVAFVVDHRVASPSEMVYRLYMGFYGLVFPAYVWICVVGSPERRPSKAAVGVFLVAIAVALPAFWMGFIQGRMLWLVPGLGAVLLAKLAVPRPGRSRETVGVE